MASSVSQDQSYTATNGPISLNLVSIELIKGYALPPASTSLDIFVHPNQYPILTYVHVQHVQIIARSHPSHKNVFPQFRSASSSHAAHASALHHQYRLPASPSPAHRTFPSTYARLS